MVSNGVRVHLSLNPLLPHLLITHSQHLITRPPRSKVLEHDILHAVRRTHALTQALRHLSLVRPQDVAEVLHVGVHAHHADAEVNVQDRPWVDCGRRAGPTREGGGVEDFDARLVPSGEILLLDLVAEPPLDVLHVYDTVQVSLPLFLC